MVVGRRLGDLPSATTIFEETVTRLPGFIARMEAQAPKTQPYIGDRRLPLRSSNRFALSPPFGEATVINLHLLHGNFFDYRALLHWARVKPLVWTLHDMWPLTGHCAYSFACERWRTGCHDCPLYTAKLRHLDEVPQPKRDRTASSWRAKRTTYAGTPITAVAPSRWLNRLARESILVAHPMSSVHHIPYGLDTEIYRPLDRQEARSVLQIPADRKVVLFTASPLEHARKGLGDLEAAFSLIEDRVEGLYLLTLGAGGRRALEREGRAIAPSFDERLQALVYSAADVVAVPSLADNQPLVALEAMACGKPVLAYASGGIPEVVSHMETGYCAPPGEPEALATGLEVIFGDDDLAGRMGTAARARAVSEHSLKAQAARYLSLYEETAAVHEETIATAKRVG